MYSVQNVFGAQTLLNANICGNNYVQMKKKLPVNI